MHKIESILTSITSSLSTALPSANVERTPVYKSDISRVLVRQGQEGTDLEGAFTDANFELIITQVVIGLSTELETTANQQRSDIHKVLMSLQGTISGMTSISSLRVEEPVITSEQPALTRELVYKVRYRYNTQDPSL